MKSPAGPCLAAALFALSIARPAVAQTPAAERPAIAAVGTAEPAAAPLSRSTQEKIARMKPIFDGKTLDGWIQAPPAPNTFSSNDVTNVANLARKLADKSDPIAAFLNAQLDEPAKAALAAFSPTVADARPTISVLVRNLNRILAGASIYEPARFERVRLRAATSSLQRSNPTGQELMRLNRMLLEDAFPDLFAISPATSWIVKDGAMASTGGGRGVIYTKDDYSHYRLIFTMRHVSGQPDHHPCILIFCQRPPAGERGLDALGAIQFQTPNGGHWDYRPGQNHAGTGFTRPIRTKFDNHEWHQVEVLVDARTGKARMAVAQPVGTRAIENLMFSDAAAGRTGPIAWQMHNAGLFDEFKDVRLELDPTEDRLLTVE
jgi:hypothetical protein